MYDGYIDFIWFVSSSKLAPNKLDKTLPTLPNFWFDSIDRKTDKKHHLQFNYIADLFDCAKVDSARD